jgi:phospholipid:diacylglycerol acyltransferase
MVAGGEGAMIGENVVSEIKTYADRVKIYEEEKYL